MQVEYSTTNSGGSWWLSEKDWLALEKAGWEVQWGGQYFCHSEFSTQEAPAGKPEPCKQGDECPGHRKADSLDEAKKGRHTWLGAPAKEAFGDFDSPASAVGSFEAATGMDASAEGCNCCGPPHSFSWDGGYASGVDIVNLLYPGSPRTLREAAERGLK